MSLEFRHIASYLIWYCSRLTNEELLHEVFSVSATSPSSILKTKCYCDSVWPIPHCATTNVFPAIPVFSDPRLTGILFPTLIACCYNNQSNTAILELELSCALLANFIEEKILETQAKSTSSSSSKKAPEKELGDQRMALLSRFPQEQLTAAQEYFKAT
uniref:S phase cyclin A-associated protein in the endoplasmic reticulum-like n=1 Tax=Crassostrea virginica TaxID=6565 RepID=A0A8B8DVP1_CRAVI|nr:S phase cyclin A-associated protein in the endoplasmic reticulum-like [Crassostrea virginica]